MAIFISCLLFALATLLAVPVGVLLIEVIASIARAQQNCLSSPLRTADRRVAVLIPAHNESTNLLPTLADVKAQIHTGDRLLVVADNCTDDTAAVAATAGAEVVERNDRARIGKGYALAWGTQHLEDDPPDIVVMLDADCALASTTIDRLTAACMMTNRPVQGLYLMISAGNLPNSSRVAEFAWRIRNWVRPSGLKALGLPCQLMGSGMAFRWNLIRSVDLASGLIVEDLKLGLDLALAGYPPVFCPSAIVTSHFPSSAEATKRQRARWEQGHIRLMVTTAPRLIVAAIARANWDLLVMALDLAVPPIALLGIMVMAMFVVAVVAKLLGVSSPALFVSSANLMAFTATIFVAWFKYGRDILTPTSILSMCPYVIRKLSFYHMILLRKYNVQWTRTDRTSGNVDN